MRDRTLLIIEIHHVFLITMHAHRTPPLQVDETVFSCLDVNKVLEIAANSGGKSLMEAAETFVMPHVRKLIRNSRDHAVHVSLRLCAVEDAVSEIADLKPWTMSWSNVLDYMNEVHRLRRIDRIQKRPTIPYLDLKSSPC